MTSFGTFLDHWLTCGWKRLWWILSSWWTIFFFVKIFIKCNWYFKIFPMNISTFLLYYNYFKKLNLCFLSFFFWCLIHKRFVIDHYKFLDTQNLVWKVFIVCFFNDCPKLNNVDLWHPVLNKKTGRFESIGKHGRWQWLLLVVKQLKVLLKSPDWYDFNF